MRSAAKILFVFLLGLMLADMQGAALFAGLSPTANCACPPPACTKACCATRQMPTPQPVAPVRASNPSSLFVAVLVRSLAVLPNLRQVAAVPFSSSPLVATAVPLYQRDCTYLI